MPQTLIVIVLLALILGGAAAYLLRAKKRGQKCVGCPYSGNCGKGGGQCSCK